MYFKIALLGRKLNKFVSVARRTLGYVWETLRCITLEYLLEQYIYVV